MVRKLDDAILGLLARPLRLREKVATSKINPLSSLCLRIEKFKVGEIAVGWYIENGVNPIVLHRFGIVFAKELKKRTKKLRVVVDDLICVES